MIAPLWLALGALFGALLATWVLGRRQAQEHAQKARGYTITFPTLDAAADAYQGKGTVMRLEVFGAYPLSPKEVEAVGARYLATLQKRHAKLDQQWAEVTIPPRSQTQPIRSVQMLDPTEIVRALKSDCRGAMSSKFQCDEHEWPRGQGPCPGYGHPMGKNNAGGQ